MSGHLDRAIAAGYARAMARCGAPVTVRRVNGQAPRTATISAVVPAIVRNVAPDVRDASRTGYSASDIGAITQDDRDIVVLVCDLVRARFPLPVAKNDSIILASGETLNVIDVDDEKGRLGGAIAIKASGVA